MLSITKLLDRSQTVEHDGRWHRFAKSAVATLDDGREYLVPASYGTFRTTRRIGCVLHDEPSEHYMTCDGEWATGETLLSGYTPRPGELVQNHVMVCEVDPTNAQAS